ncbi:unnamed protein product [Didymodactylos carnosus]|uniref:Uncharacterized protein n=2 Tax=Didymodactylos carnosus TaxID=1234261 RepID=A0A813QS88_9BILA|nr:unnamed protein product [Didymodactylos carnosus]CAF3552569.1 unnamed protein product [Didymodactylos carnosus]
MTTNSSEALTNSHHLSHLTAPVLTHASSSTTIAYYNRDQDRLNNNTDAGTVDYGRQYPLLPNQNGFTSDMSTTRSLHNLQLNTNSYSHNDQNDIFEDAVENLNDDIGDATRSLPASTGAGAMTEKVVDLTQGLIDGAHIMKLIFQNRLNEALVLAKDQYVSTRLIEQRNLMDDMEATLQSLRQTIHLAKKRETYRSWISSALTGTKQVMGEYELHAKLVYAEALLLQALLMFIQDQGLFSFLSGALKIKECHDAFLKLAKNNDPSKFSTPLLHEHFDSGVRMGNGAFNLMIASLPQRIIKYLEFAGFSGDKEYGLQELEKSSKSNGIRAPLSALFLLGYHTFAGQILGNGEGDVELAHNLTENYLRIYPNSYMFLVFRARLQTLRCHLNEGISTYEQAISSQNDWRNLHHISHWEILWCRVLLHEWNEAAKMADILLNESSWSKATYCYLLATFLFEANKEVASEDIIKLYNRVPGLKIRLAGKSIPMEKYAIKKCEQFQVQKWLFLPALELVYIMNGFYILYHNEKQMRKTLDIVNRGLENLKATHTNDAFFADSLGTGYLLRGVILFFLHHYDEALEALDEVLSLTKQFEEKSYLPPNALLEKGLIYTAMKQNQKASECLHKALNDHKDYQLESRLHFRANAALWSLKQMDAQARKESKKSGSSNKKTSDTRC